MVAFVALVQWVMGPLLIAMTIFDWMFVGRLEVDRQVPLRAVECSLIAVFFALTAMQGFSLHKLSGTASGVLFAALSGVAAYVAMRWWDDWRRRRRRKRKRSTSRVVLRLGRLVVAPR